MLHHLLIHSANIIYLASYAVKDLRLLRFLTVAAVLLLIPYYIIFHLWEATLWNVVFLGINIYRLKRTNENQQATTATSVPNRMR